MHFDFFSGIIFLTQDINELGQMQQGNRTPDLLKVFIYITVVLCSTAVIQYL